MQQSLIHRVFASIFGIWIAFLLRRDPLNSFSIVYSTIILIFVGFLTYYINESISIVSNRIRFGFLIPTMIIGCITALGISKLEKEFYSINALPDQMIYFLMAIVYIWLLINEIIHRVYHDKEWERE